MTEPVTRRCVITAAAGVAAALAAPSSRIAGAAAAPATPTEILAAYRKMHFALHERPLFWWIKATKYGLVDDEITALYQMDIASFFELESDRDGFIRRSLEIVYSTDVESGELLTEWENPYTGAVVPVSHTPIGPTRMRYGPQGRELPTSLPGAQLESHHETALNVEGDGIWFRDDTSAVVTQLDGKSPKPFRVYDWSTYHSKLSDVVDKSTDSAPCTIAFQAISGWQRWMGMGAAPGNLLSRGSGQKVAAFDDLPSSFRTLLAENHSEIADDPIGALGMDQFRFER